MWKKIDNLEIIAGVSHGDLISDNPQDETTVYQVHGLANGYIRLLHLNGVNSLKIFPEKDLISGKWWIRK